MGARFSSKALMVSDETARQNLLLALRKQMELDKDELTRLRQICAGRLDAHPRPRVWEWRDWVPRPLRFGFAFVVPFRYVFMKLGPEVKFRNSGDADRNDSSGFTYT